MKKITVKYIDTTEVICNIEYDTIAESPREWDNLGKMVLSHGRYTFENAINLDFDDYESWEEVRQFVTKEHGAVIVLPVQMYEHGGISLYIGDSHDRWDGGQLGLIFATAEDIRAWFTVKKITKAIKEQVITALTQEVEIYSKWVDGQCYSYTLTDKRGNLIDACAGWFDIDDIKADLQQYSNITYLLEGQTY